MNYKELSKVADATFNYSPKTNKEFRDLVTRLVQERGVNADLNDIDVSNITDMSFAFNSVSDFNGDISKWNVSNAINMKCMFRDSKFNGDISNWNVSNVTSMDSMFENAQFNGDISKWNVSNVKNMDSMFYESNFNGDISNWNVSNVTSMDSMFSYSKFKGDLSKWNVSKATSMDSTFYKSLLSKTPPRWYSLGEVGGVPEFEETKGSVEEVNIGKFKDGSPVYHGYLGVPSAILRKVSEDYKEEFESVYDLPCEETSGEDKPIGLFYEEIMLAEAYYEGFDSLDDAKLRIQELSSHSYE